MAFVTPRTWSTEVLTSALLNQQLRDNMNAIWIYTTKGDISIAKSSTIVDRLAVGSDNQVLMAEAAQTLGLKYKTIAAAAKLARATNQSISDSTFTAIQFTSETYDLGDLADIGADNTRFTIPASFAGYYSLSGYAKFAASGATSSGRREIQFYKNGADQLETDTRDDVVDNSAVDVAISADLSLAATDYIEVRVLQSTGGALNITKASFSIKLIWLT